MSLDTRLPHGVLADMGRDLAMIDSRIGVITNAGVVILIGYVETFAKPISRSSDM